MILFLLPLLWFYPSQVRGVSSFPDAAVCIGTLAFGAVQAAKVPAPLALVASGVLGVIAWAADMQ